MSSTVSDTDSDVGSATIHPTTFTANSNIDITAQPAVITWRTLDDDEQCLSHVTFDLHYDARSSKAFFKLRAAVALKSHQRSRNTPIFLFVHPEHIRALAVEESPCATEAAALGPETVGLRFEMSRLPSLVVPKESLAPRNQTSGKVIDSLRAIAQKATFSVYVKLPCRLLPRQKLQALCSAISRKELRSIAAHANASSLYAGAGGNLIDGDSLCSAQTTTCSKEPESTTRPLAEDPPSYDEVPAGPPSAEAPGSYKRRRLESPEAESVPQERLDRKHIEDICAQIIDSRLSQLKDDVSKQLQDLENRIIDYVDEQLIVQRRETTEEVGLQTEDKYYGLKLDLESYVREEVEEAEGRILDHLGTASFSLQLNT
ncbi:hypothetical protein NPX13_g6126 [Xylaria arbuscula]|uniref:Uncharacterized protein n=1 Tax=Xylaria arbuscula TaxID=114810 RepID=A0A9W8ND38_9PEZI|nr:hypothetical protein NPX13_g6126 [Xylaria arbuscula]